MSVDDILNNPEVHPVGIQTAPETSWMGGIMFVHDRPTCMTSFLVPFHLLEPLLTPTTGHSPHRMDINCDHRCESVYNPEPCHRDCLNARYHQFMVDLLKRREDTVVETCPGKRNEPDFG